MDEIVNTIWNELRIEIEYEVNGMKKIKLMIIFLISFGLYACESVPERPLVNPEKADVAPESEIIEQKTESGRKLILDGEEITENDIGEFVTWKCGKYPSGERVLVEFGKIIISDEYIESEEYKKLDNSKREEFGKFINKLGFVLYEGGNVGDFALYERRGLNHRWDWGPDSVYSFIIKPDGIGLFYDFSNSKSGVMGCHPNKLDTHLVVD